MIKLSELMMDKVELLTTTLFSEGRKSYLKNFGAAFSQNNFLTKEQKKLLKCTNPKFLGMGHKKDIYFKKRKKGRGATANVAYQHSTATGDQQYTLGAPMSEFVVIGKT
jgi:hypothetical protein